jgi:hypothetical protein
MNWIDNVKQQYPATAEYAGIAIKVVEYSRPHIWLIQRDDKVPLPQQYEGMITLGCADVPLYLVMLLERYPALYAFATRNKFSMPRMLDTAADTLIDAVATAETPQALHLILRALRIDDRDVVYKQ